MGYLRQLTKNLIRKHAIEVAFSGSLKQDNSGNLPPPDDDHGDSEREEFTVAVVAEFGLKSKLDAILNKYQPGRKFSIDPTFFGDNLTEKDLDLEDDDICGFDTELKLTIPRALNLRKDLRAIVKHEGSVDILSFDNDDTFILDPNGEWIKYDDDDNDLSSIDEML